MTATATQSKKTAMGRSRKEVDTSTYTGRFAVNLRRLREAAKLTVEELAEKTGIPKRTLYDWESNRTTPNVENLEKLSSVLNVSIRTLLPQK